jgi:homoserine dehydrogenase
MVTPLRIGIAGLGNVGAGVVKILTANAELVAKRAGRPIVVTAVSARDRSRDRGVSLDGIAWVDDAAELATRDDVDVVVELIGGSDGPALTLARRTLGAAKPLVTANKAMLAHHGLELAEAAEKAGLPLKYEAAVAGGIPVIKGLAEGAAANRITRVYGLMNGTCNYILSRMEAEGLGFGDVLADAQALGFAEADPSFDIDGIDTAHKLSILAALAFGARIDFAGVACHGIRNVAAADIAQAAALGARRAANAAAARAPVCLQESVVIAAPNLARQGRDDLRHGHTQVGASRSAQPARRRSSRIPCGPSQPTRHRRPCRLQNRGCRGRNSRQAWRSSSCRCT